MMMKAPLLRDNAGHAHDGEGARVDGSTLRSLEERGLIRFFPFAKPLGVLTITGAGIRSLDPDREGLRTEKRQTSPA